MYRRCNNLSLLLVTQEKETLRFSSLTDDDSEQSKGD
jgi:hypothetical protein